MKNRNPFIEELKVLKDEVKLQAHLFSMESKEKFDALEVRFYVFEKKIEDYAVKLGEFNEDHFTIHKEELNELKKEYDNLKISNVEGK